MTCRRFGNLILFVIIDAFPASDRPSISDCWPLFSAFVIQRFFDKLRSCFSNAKFTNFGNSRNPRVTSSSIWAQVDCPAESWKRLLFLKPSPRVQTVVRRKMASDGASLKRQSEGRESAVFKQTIRERTGI